jgi:retron-type reverse transcriptase
VLEFTDQLEENLINIQNHLIWKSYAPGAYKKFIVYEPKKRQIMALPFPDRVVQHALNNIVEPIFDKAFFFHSYACRKGKGMHEASINLSHWLHGLHQMHGERVYCLKADISKYFASIDHETLRRVMRKKIKCPDTLWLIDLVIAHNGGETEGKGIPVGNLTSQLFANAYLGELDKFVKEGLRVRYYMRYMDDFVVLSHDKAYLRGALAMIAQFIVDDLRLQLNPKTAIFKARQGVDFVGYRHWHTHKLIRKSSIKRITRKIRLFNKQHASGKLSVCHANRSIQSWLGHIGHADTHGIRSKILNMILSESPPGDSGGNL